MRQSKFIAAFLVLIIVSPILIGSVTGLYELNDNVELSEWSTDEGAETEKEAEKEFEKKIDALINGHNDFSALGSSGSQYLLKYRSFGNVCIDVLTPPPEYI